MDLPGGTVEKDETFEEAAIREVYEESGIHVEVEQLTLIEKKKHYIHFGAEYALYSVTFDRTPSVALSWEHADYSWVGKQALIQGAKDTNDHFLQMAVDNIEKV